MGTGRVRAAVNVEGIGFDIHDTGQCIHAID